MQQLSPHLVIPLLLRLVQYLDAQGDAVAPLFVRILILLHFVGMNSFVQSSLALGVVALAASLRLNVLGVDGLDIQLEFLPRQRLPQHMGVAGAFRRRSLALMVLASEVRRRPLLRVSLVVVVLVVRPRAVDPLLMILPFRCLQWRHAAKLLILTVVLVPRRGRVHSWTHFFWYGQRGRRLRLGEAVQVHLRAAALAATCTDEIDVAVQGLVLDLNAGAYEVRSAQRQARGVKWRRLLFAAQIARQLDGAL